ncbi:MAG TPA: glycosyltransferase [Solirubrobacteraceae bacterium]|nr:glycosyltransferase [Solirubrobacteraceae bacterium]
MIADPRGEAGPGGGGVSVVIPNWNGARWLPGCLRALAAQTLVPAQVIVVDNGSRDGSLEYLRAEHPEVELLALGANTGFAGAANRGIERAAQPFVALLNTDVEPAADWLQRMAGALASDPAAASVACKMLSLAEPGIVYDAGDVLRRDGACEQRGRFLPDDGRWDEPGEVFGACAGAAVYRREAVLAAGGFDERYFAYLEDVDLALRLRLAGWGCRYEPAVALHAGEGSSSALAGGHRHYVARNTLLLVARFFPARWAPLVAYRQLGWAWHALGEHRLATHLRALLAAAPLLPGALAERRSLRDGARVAIEQAIPASPIRAPLITGERVSTPDGGFNPSFQRHRAEYRLAAALLGPGPVLDLGCGVGHSFAELAPRETVGVDVEPAALAGQRRETHVADMRALPFADASFESVVSIQSIEHVPDPDRALTEAARVLAPGGLAVIVTPNRLTFGRPDEIIDPYHYVEYDADQLRALCAPHFESVRVLGLRASERYLAIHDDERRELDRLLALDPLALRRLIPRRARQWLYDWRLSGDRITPRDGALEIGVEDFWLSDDGLERAIDLFAVCAKASPETAAGAVTASASETAAARGDAARTWPPPRAS